MKLRNKIITASLMMFSILAIAAFAQGPRGQRGPGGPGGPPPGIMGGPGGPGGPGGGLPLRALDLTDAQKEQAKAIHEAERTKIEPFMKQLGEAHKALAEATANGQFDEAQVRAIAATMSQAQVELAVSRARQDAAIYQILTADQRAKLEQFRADHKPPRGPRPDGN